MNAYLFQSSIGLIYVTLSVFHAYIMYIQWSKCLSNAESMRFVPLIIMLNEVVPLLLELLLQLLKLLILIFEPLVMFSNE